MKTAISLPDALFERITRRAAELGLSRSEFLANAAAKHLDSLDSEMMTDRIDAALADLAQPEESSDAAVAVGRRVLGDGSGEW